MSDIFCGLFVDFNSKTSPDPTSPSNGPRKVSRAAANSSKTTGNFLNDFINDYILDEKSVRQQQVQAALEKEAEEKRLKAEEMKQKENERLQKLKEQLDAQAALKKLESPKASSIFARPMSPVSSRKQAPSSPKDILEQSNSRSEAPAKSSTFSMFGSSPKATLSKSVSFSPNDTKVMENISPRESPVNGMIPDTPMDSFSPSTGSTKKKSKKKKNIEEPVAFPVFPSPF